MNSRRNFLKKLSLTAGAGLAGSTGLYSFNSLSANLSGYKALVVIHLNGGNDSNDMLVPLDGAFSDYEKARSSIAVKKDALQALSGMYLGHSLGVNKAISPLVDIFNAGRMAFVVNAGALVKPTTVAEVLNGKAILPPFLYSHPEQTQYVQGWMGDEDPSGWGGRAMEAFSAQSELKSPLLSVNTSNNTAVLGQKSRIVNANTWSSSRIGMADLMNPKDSWTQVTESMTRLQSNTSVEAEYARTFRGVFLDSKALAFARNAATEPAGNFEDNDIATRLRYIAQTMPYYKVTGAPRQIYFTEWGSFDTHANQRYTGVTAGNADQDGQLAQLAKALAAFDQSMIAAGMSNEVAVLVTSEFNRTLDPAAGNGSDHAWGGHWMVMGGRVNGARMFGEKFPSLVLGGVDDVHEQKRGYWLPQISSDQVAADMLTWLGLPSDKLSLVMPNLANFNIKTLGLMNG